MNNFQRNIYRIKEDIEVFGTFILVSDTGGSGISDPNLMSWVYTGDEGDIIWWNSTPISVSTSTGIEIAVANLSNNIGFSIALNQTSPSSGSFTIPASGTITINFELQASPSRDCTLRLIFRESTDIVTLLPDGLATGSSSGF